MAIFGGLKKTKVAAPAEERKAECTHWELAPRWASAADMGKPDRVTSYNCTGCGASFTPDQAREMRSV